MWTNQVGLLEMMVEFQGEQWMSKEQPRSEQEIVAGVVLDQQVQQEQVRAEVETKAEAEHQEANLEVEFPFELHCNWSKGEDTL